jgi:(S)-sulfolactate dehydrogenase
MVDIVISEFMDEAALSAELAGFALLYDPKLVDAPEALAASLASARALIVRNRTQVNASLLAHAPKLTVVGRLGVGLDNIDLEACQARNITVYPATGANDLSVAEYVISAILILLRGTWFATDPVRQGAWPRAALIQGQEMSGKTLGLVGFGSIARETGARARAMGMHIIAYDPYLPADNSAWQMAQRLELDELLAKADVVSLHVPGGLGTANLLNRMRLAQMKQGAILINAARGGIVDEAALVDALKSGALGSAALDVFNTEPVTPQSGALFQGVPNLLLTPHIAGVTLESNARVSTLIAQKVKAHLQS